MTIAAQCGSCKKRFAAKEKLAGRKVKCPQCGSVLTIPKPQPKPEPEPAPLMNDLLDEFEVASPPPKDTGPSTADAAGPAGKAPSTESKCSSCGASMTAGAVVCVECGYNTLTGKKREVVGPEKSDKGAFPWVKVSAIGGMVLFALMLAFIGYLMVLPPAAIRVSSSGISETPKDFVEVEFGAKEYLCEHPKGWEVFLGDGKEGAPAWAKFEKGGAFIQIRDSLAGGAVLERSLTIGTAIERGEAPVDQVHAHRAQAVAAMMRGYEESAAQDLDHFLGDALISEFTARPVFGKRVHGYHATVLHGHHQFTFVCRCAESEWATLKPAFDHVISTLEPVEEDEFSGLF